MGQRLAGLHLLSRWHKIDGQLDCELVGRSSTEGQAPDSLVGRVMAGEDSAGSPEAESAKFLRAGPIPCSGGSARSSNNR
jgi:hypothetical protein